MRPVRRRRAAAVVEMAFVAPVLFLMTLGAIEFGRAMMVANILTSSAREGARVAVVPNGANSDVTAAVNREVTAGAISASSVTTTVLVNGAQKDASTAVVGDQVTVTVTVPFSAVTWLPFKHVMATTTLLRGQAVMRRE